MDFTIFYAWQSDRTQNTHRYVIRDAAKEAVRRIGRDASVEDSPRLDHDTKDVSGTPERARSSGRSRRAGPSSRISRLLGRRTSVVVK
jgi:hypothetical protein